MIDRNRVPTLLILLLQVIGLGKFAYVIFVRICDFVELTAAYLCNCSFTIRQSSARIFTNFSVRHVLHRNISTAYHRVIYSKNFSHSAYESEANMAAIDVQYLPLLQFMV